MTPKEYVDMTVEDFRSILDAIRPRVQEHIRQHGSISGDEVANMFISEAMKRLFNKPKP